MFWGILFVIFVAVFAVALVGTKVLITHLRQRAILDHPNARSSHDAPTPRGGGIALLGALLPAWGLIAASGLSGPLSSPSHTGIILICALVLALLSWQDDLKGLSPLWRLFFQFAAVGVGLYALPEGSLVFQGFLPPLLDSIATVFLWVWFINLFNFMDGIDGISGVQAGSIGFGLFAFSLALGGGMALKYPAPGLFGLTLLAAAAGFLRWNWAPAKIFLGDVGSIPLGFLLGWLLLGLAAAGEWVAAIILPLYYLSDATLTLVKRLLKGERVWEAHRDHFYQMAIMAGSSHETVSFMVLFANLGLVALVVLTALVPTPGAALLCLTGAVIMVTALLVKFAKMPTPPS